MSTREFFKIRLAAEQPAFVRVLRALPSEKLDYAPHERSATAGGIAWQLAQEQKALATLSAGGDVSLELPPVPARLEEIVDLYESQTERLLEILETLDDARWTGPSQFLMDGKVLWTSTVDNIFWGFLFDMIHHRGQLSAYIRPMGGKVPNIYGPSADGEGG